MINSKAILRCKTKDIAKNPTDTKDYPLGWRWPSGGGNKRPTLNTGGGTLDCGKKSGA